MGNTCNCYQNKSNANLNEVEVPSRYIEEQLKNQPSIIFIQNNYNSESNNCRDPQIDIHKLIDLQNTKSNTFLKESKNDWTKDNHEFNSEIIKQEFLCSKKTVKNNDGINNQSKNVLDTSSMDQELNKSIRGGNPKQRGTKENYKDTLDSNLLCVNRITSDQKLGVNNFQHTKSIQDIARNLICDKESETSSPNLVFTFYGQSGTGKSSIVYKICNNTIDQFHIPTIKVESFTKTFKHETNNYKINLIDTIGLAYLQPNTDEILKVSDFVFYVVDLTDYKSYDNIKNVIQSHMKISLSFSKIILGNKFDLCKNKDLISKIKEFAESNSMVFFETSAKTNYNLNKLMRYCVEQYEKKSILFS
jgi:small GTP-binding protein